MTNASDAGFTSDLAHEVWASRYRYGSAERAIGDSWDRVARAIASVEPRDRAAWERSFRRILEGFRFLPAGRILAGAGTARDVTLFNCFVMDFIDDSVDAIFEELRRSAVTMQWGGGIGVDFSTLRPRGAVAAMRGNLASGPVSFMRIWDAMCATMLSTGARRGAMMGTLRCDHPDIEEFIDAKRRAGALTNFNLSVQVTDELMAAVEADDEFALCFPADGVPEAGDVKHVRWPGCAAKVPCRIVRRLPARALWRRIMSAAYDSAEPGVLFVDEINRSNNLHYCEHITSTNPCGEVPLPPNGACDLGSVNLCAFVREPFSPRAAIDLEALERTVRTATRLLDDIIDLSAFPLREQAEHVTATRRLGLGLTGLGDALAMLGLEYDSPAGRAAAREWLESIRDAAYRESTVLAEERGSFPAFEREPYLSGEYVRTLPADIRDAIAHHGIRNSHLIAIAPTGTISLLANNVSSGIEPVYALEGMRRVLDDKGTVQSLHSVDYAFSVWCRDHDGAPPPSLVTAAELSPEAHLQMLAALQPLVDNSVSKTINVDEQVSHETFSSIYTRAYALGLKGCTVFRPNEVTGYVLSDEVAPGDVHCCTPEREAD